MRNLLSQSCSVANAKPITFRHSNERRSTCNMKLALQLFADMLAGILKAKGGKSFGVMCSTAAVTSFPERTLGTRLQQLVMVNYACVFNQSKRGNILNE